MDRLGSGGYAKRRASSEAGCGGNNVGGVRRSEATKVHLPLPTIVHAELGARLKLALAELPLAALWTFMHAASMLTRSSQNCKVYGSPHGTSPFLAAATTSRSRTTWCCPSGCHTPSRASSNKPAHSWPSPTSGIRVSRWTSHSRPKLTLDQAVAVGVMLGHDDGMHGPIRNPELQGVRPAEESPLARTRCHAA